MNPKKLETNLQCQECGGYELDNGVDDVCECEELEKSICRDCDGNGSFPPYWEAKCERCGGSGVV